MPGINPTAGAPARIGIDDLAKMAESSAGAWQALTMLRGLCGRHPEDHALRLVSASAWLTLGLPTPALELLEGLPEEARRHPRARAVMAGAAALPRDLVEGDALLETARRNLGAMRRRGFITGGEEQATLEGVAGLRVCRSVNVSETGERAVVWSGAGGTGGWGPILDQGRHCRANLRTLPALGGAWPGALAVLCPPPAGVVRSLHDMTRAAAGAYSPRIDVVVESIADLGVCVAGEDLAEIMPDERVSVILGEDGLERWGAALGSGTVARVPTGFVDAGGGTAAFRQRACDALREATRKVRARLDAGARKAAGGRGHEERPARSELRTGGAQHGEPRQSDYVGLRVMVASSRFSTYVRHAAEDIAAAFEARGADVYVLLEPSDCDLYSGPDRVEIVRAFDPDVLVILNHFRDQFSPDLPLDLPVVTVVQDSMPQTVSPERAGRRGPHDLVAGHITDALVTWAGGEERCFPSPVTAGRAKFAGGASGARGGPAYECDIAFVTNHSQSPEDLLEGFLRSAGDRKAVDHLRELAHACELAAKGAAMERPRTVLSRHVHDIFGCEPGEDGHERLLRLVALPLADRHVRHQTIEWASAVAQRHGLSLGLYGKGWESNPRFSRFARGHVPHDDLADLYPRLRLSLHASVNWLFHQRIMECALAGGLTLARWTMDDLSNERFGALCRAWRDGARFEEDVDGRARVYCPRGVHPSVDRALGIEVRTSQGDGTACWAWSEHMGSLLEQFARRRRLCPSELLGDPGATTFWDEASLERLVLGLVRDDEARSTTAASVREIVDARFTTEAMVDRFARELPAVRARVNGGAPSVSCSV